MGTQLLFPSTRGGAEPPVFGSCLSWPNGYMDQDETWHGDRTRSWPHCVRWGPSFPSPKGHSPQFSAHICCGKTARWIKMALGVEVGLVPGDFVLDGNQLPLPLPQRRGQSPQFSANVYCGQTTACIKMKLGMEVGLGTGHVVLDGDPASVHQKGHSPLPPIFDPHLLWPNGWIDQDGSWHVGAPRSRPHSAGWGSSSPPSIGAQPQFSIHDYCGQRAGWINMALGMVVLLGPGHILLNGDPSPLPKKAGTAPPNFRPMSIVAKRLNG